MLWVFLIAAAIAVAAIPLWRRAHRRPLVLGQQLAAAIANEKARVAAGATEPSPLPEARYDIERGDYGLIAVTPLPLDAELREVTRTFRDGSVQARLTARRGISMDGEYTLIQFAKRSAVLALRVRSAARCEDGLAALSMLDETRIDPRDADSAVGLLSHAISSTGADRNDLVDGAASLATPGMAELIERARVPGKLSDWGYAEIQTNEGQGLIRSGFARYEPTFDMGNLALRIAATLEKGRYVADPEVASEVPAVWFAKEHRADVQKILTGALAVASVSGTLRKKESPEAGAQMFVQWVAELPTEAEARALVDDVGGATPPPTRFRVGVASGRLFALLVAGSVVEGTPPFESAETLAALARETQILLAEAGPK